MSSADQPDKRTAKINDYPTWSPRFWHGMRAACWWKLLAKNRFRIAPSRLHIAVGVSFFSPVNDVLAVVQSLVHGRRIGQTQLTSPPLFILGHWRSGTTFLHELMVSDPKYASPNTYQCFAPSHFIVSEWLIARFGQFLLPKKRPMDDMDAGWQLPQEDEFALMNLGQPSPYLRIAFPRTQSKAMEYLTLTELSDEQRAAWRASLLWFLKAQTYHYGSKQLVLKSPPHTGRLAELIDLFPKAKFIHLTRDPRKLFSSTVRLWRSLDEVQSLQLAPPEQEMKEYVIQCLRQMYQEFERARATVPPEKLIDVRYEDLVAEPMVCMRRIYQDLQLGDFSAVEANLSKRLENHEAYRTNEHRIHPELDEEIRRMWPEYMERYGYEGS
jgi:hypothetical protein